MPLDDRNYIRGKHPPYCTCKDCTDRRLSKLGSSKAPERKFKGTPKFSLPHYIPPNIPRAIRRIPLFLRKLFLCLLVIAGFVVVIKTGYLLFTSHSSSIKDTVIFLVEVGFLVWFICILRSRRYKYTKPSLKLVTFLLLVLFLVFAFAGIQPMVTYKDKVINSTTSIVNKWQEQVAIKEAEVAATRTEQEAKAEAEAKIKAEEEAKKNAQQLLELEKTTFELINMIRVKQGFVAPTVWDNKLYELSKAHTQAMADKGQLFHSPMNSQIGENAWGGRGYSKYDYDKLATELAWGWFSSPLHRAWMLHAPIKHSVVSIIMTPNSQYASWTFWTKEVGTGPELVRKIADEWQRETGGSIPWIEWLIMKGYLKQ